MVTSDIVDTFRKLKRHPIPKVIGKGCFEEQVGKEYSELVNLPFRDILAIVEKAENTPELLNLCYAKIEYIIANCSVEESRKFFLQHHRVPS